MNFVSTPNLPLKAVDIIIADGRISSGCEKSLAQREITVLKTERHPGLYEAVAYHPDMMLHHVGDECIVYAPGTSVKFLGELDRLGFKLVKGGTELTAAYPCDIAYNAARIGNYVLHNLKHTDPVLKQELEKRGVQLVHVNQGYTKCSVSVVDQRSIITSDTGIARACEKIGIEVLLIEEKNISLPGLDYGFIGGCTGLIAGNRWAVSGDFRLLARASAIVSFLADRGIEVVSLSGGQVTDLGTLIPLAVK